MTTLFNAVVQIVFMVFALDVLRGKPSYGRHSYDRPGTRLASGVIISALGWEALHRFVSPDHHRRAFSRGSSWVVTA